MNFKRVNASSAFALTASARTPSAVFLTKAGVYEFDLSSRKALRVWPRTTKGTELTSSLFRGLDANGGGAQWSNPIVLAKHPTENLIAVVDGASQDPAVYFYSFEETMNASGVLTATSFKFVAKFADDTESHWLQWAAGASFYADGRLAVVMNSSSSGASSTLVEILTPSTSGTTTTYACTSSFTADFTQATGIAVDTLTESLYLAFGTSKAVVRYVAETVEGAADGAKAAHDLVLGEINVPGSAAGQLGSPQSIEVVHPSDCAPATIVVTDTYNHRVVAFDTLGRVRFSYGTQGSSAAGTFLNPRSFYLLDEDGTAGTSATLAVADSGNRRIQLFSCDTTDLEEEDNTIAFEPETTVYDESDDIAGNFQFYVITETYDREITIDVTSTPSGAAAVGLDEASLLTTPASITVSVPANTDHGSFVFTPLNGVAADTDVAFSFTYDGAEVASTNLTIKNLAPTMVSVSNNVHHVVDGNRLAPVWGSDVDLVFEATDVAADVAAGLTYTWTLPTSGDNTGSAEMSGVDMTNVTFTADLVGSQVAMCVVTDPDGGSTSYRWSFDVSDPYTWGEVSPSTINESDETEYSITFTVEESDIDREYVLGIAGTLAEEGGVEAVTADVTVAAGETSGTFTFWVPDALAAEDSAFTLSISSADGHAVSGSTYSLTAINVAPVITDLGANIEDGATVDAGTTITVDASAGVEDVDADLEGMTYNWTFGGASFSTEATGEVTLPDDADGKYLIVLTVTDPQGATATSTLNFGVGEQTVLSWNGLVSEPAYENDETPVSLTFTVNAYTEDRSYTFALAGGLVDAGYASLAAESATVAAGETEGEVRVLVKNAGTATGVDNTLTLTVTSPYGTTCSGSFTPENAAPVIVSATPSVADGGTLAVGDAWTGSAEVTDVAADLEGMTYDWTLDGTTFSTAATASFTATSAGEHTVVLTVTDPDGASASTSITLTVTGSSQFTAGSVAITSYDFSACTAAGKVTMTSGDVHDVPFTVESSSDLKSWTTFLAVPKSVWSSGTEDVSGETVTATAAADNLSGDVTFTFSTLPSSGCVYLRISITNPGEDD